MFWGSEAPLIGLFELQSMSFSAQSFAASLPSGYGPLPQMRT
jgi:hypothetical protein